MNVFSLVPSNFYVYSPKSLRPSLVSIEIMFKHCGVTLSKTINIKDGAQVVKLVITCKVHGFPDRTLGRFRVTNEAEHAITKKQP